MGDSRVGAMHVASANSREKRPAPPSFDSDPSESKEVGHLKHRGVLMLCGGSMHHNWRVRAWIPARPEELR